MIYEWANGLYPTAKKRGSVGPAFGLVRTRSHSLAKLPLVADGAVALSSRAAGAPTGLNNKKGPEIHVSVLATRASRTGGRDRARYVRAPGARPAGERSGRFRQRRRAAGADPPAQQAARRFGPEGAARHLAAREFRHAAHRPLRPRPLLERRQRAGPHPLHRSLRPMG